MAQLGITDSALMDYPSLHTFGVIPEGTKVVEKGQPIFPRLDVEEEVAYIQSKMGGAPAKKKTQTGTQKKWNYQAKKKSIKYDDFR